MEYNNRRYVIFNTIELDKINFTQVLETSAETVRLSIDGTSTFVKYDGEMPSSVYSLESKSQEYTHDEFSIILASPEWNLPLELP